MNSGRYKEMANRFSGILAHGLAGAVLLLAMPGLQATEPSSTKPQRIVTLNLCADQLVLSLAEPKRVLAVSRLATDPTFSNVVEQARGVPIYHKRAEEIVRLSPDLIVSGEEHEHQINHLLRRLGYTVLVLKSPDSIQGIREQIRMLAAALGEKKRGEAVITKMNVALDSLTGAPKQPLKAVVYRPNGYTSGRSTIVHEILAYAGLSNMAADIGIERWGTISLETLVRRRPHIVILDDDLSQQSSVAQRALMHPAFDHIAARTRIVTIPPKLWICPGPWVASAAAALVAATAGDQ